MGAEKNVATLRSLVDAINRRALDEVAEKIAPGFVRHDLASVWPGVEGASGVRDFLSMLIAGVPDLHIEIEQIWGNDERAAMWIRSTGTHTGEALLGAEPKGASLDISGVNLYRFEEGKIAETWQMPDAAGFLRQLGLIDC